MDGHGDGDNVMNGILLRGDVQMVAVSIRNDGGAEEDGDAMEDDEVAMTKREEAGIGTGQSIGGL